MLAFQDRLALCGIGAVPLPATASVNVESEALLRNEMFAEAAPLVCGVKVTVNGTLWPAARVMGTEIPLTANSELLDDTEETVTPAPLAISVPVCVVLVPTTTLPKLRLLGFVASCPTLLPVPVNAIFRFGLEAFEVSARVPFIVPAVVGANETVKVTLCPGAKACGRLSPVRLNPVPETATWMMLRLLPPEFVKVSNCEPVPPTGTVLKLMLEGLGVSVGGVIPVPDNGTLMLALEALLAIARFPLTVPLDAGANVIFKVAACPGARVTGPPHGLTLNPNPLVVT